MKNNAIILGGQPLNIGIADLFHSIGLNVVVIDYRENINLKYDKHILFDATNPNVIEIIKKEGIDNVKVVYTSMDNAGLAQRELCKYFNLLYAPKEAMINAHNKNLMHKVWSENNLLNRISFALDTFNPEKIIDLNKEHKVIIKPSDSCASRGITILDKNSTTDAIERAFNYAKDNSQNSFVNIEEFIDGTEFTVEMLGDNYGNVSVFGISKKYHTQNAPKNKVAIKLHYNALDVDQKLQNKIAETGIKCYKTLGLKNTLGHLEIILKENGELSPVELGARSSGFIASHLAQAGVDQVFLQEFMEVLNGKKITNGLLPQNNTSAMYYFYDMKPNKPVRKVTNITNYLNSKISSPYFDRSNIILNKIYSTLKQDTDRYGYEILIGPKELLTIENVKKAEKEFCKDLFDE